MSAGLAALFVDGLFGCGLARTVLCTAGEGEHEMECDRVHYSPTNSRWTRRLSTRTNSS